MWLDERGIVVRDLPEIGVISRDAPDLGVDCVCVQNLVVRWQEQRCGVFGRQPGLVVSRVQHIRHAILERAHDVVRLSG